MAASRMLVVAADDALHRDVATRLHALCGQKADTTAHSQLLTLATKYYRAAVDVHVRLVRDNAVAVALDADGFEALIGVVDAAHDDSFKHVEGFLAQLVAREQPDVRLLVAHNAGVEAPTAVARHVEQLQSWCQDNEFELVDLLGNVDANDNQAGAGRETRGMARVLEALECNMWASMVMNANAHGGGALAEEDEDEDDGGLRELANVTVALATPDAEDERKGAAAAPAIDAGALTPRTDQEATPGDKDDDERLQSLLRALEITEAADGAAASSSAGAGKKSSSNQRSTTDEEEADVDMAEFSALISEVRRVRDSGQSLTDEQRRQRAAEVAMKLWGFLGADDESDDDGE
ncbi:hypothetical protein PybrP1_004388 [[Pythium] brassicae (nom. inval.)]|nr:hypothetical protein PybrP1_004388 [[Pythium] brassicae (nom. inval.)]